MRIPEVQNVVKRSLAKARFKYMGNVRGQRQVWVSDEEDWARTGSEVIYEDLAKTFRGLTSCYVEEARETKGYVELYVDNVTVEIIYGKLGNDITTGVCMFIAYEEN